MAVKTRRKKRVKRQRKKTDPLKVDPTRTTMLRGRFVTFFRAKLKRFRDKITKLVIDDDAFLISKNRKALIGNNAEPPVGNTQFKFETTPAQVAAFEEWLLLNSEMGTAGSVEGFIQQGYEQGAGRALSQVKSQGGALGLTSQTQAEFLQSAFAHPIAQEKLELLVGRTMSGIQGITDANRAQMIGALADGLVKGQGPREIARSLTGIIDGATRNRLLTLARTEIVRAHAEGQLVALDRMGIKKVKVMVEWKTVGDDRVCRLCQPMEGAVLTLKEAQGMIPRHPNCRCAWIPANIGEDRKGQKRTRGTIRGAIKASVRAERGGQGTPANSTWGGSTTPISKSRPKSFEKSTKRKKKQGKRQR